ncbi:beclin-1-like protein isoform X2 [Punica granatum]|uniref:Beclin-1-like protein isoform X2 n=1 Tax=Punica granatum TaxID=22663 RepID=A0A6P8C3I8_PUNGR|nr:beclin-1-like protein isoform X2 [Punica granatum]
MTPPPLTIEVIRNRKQTVEDESAKVSDREEKKRSEMKHSTAEDKGRAFPVDQNLPRWLCQNCHHSLCFVGADSYVEKYLPDSSSRSGMHVSSIHGASSVLDSTRMDNSFVVLPKQSPQRQGLPLHPQGGGPTQTDSSSLGKVMDESFVVVYKNESASDGGASQSPVSDGAHGAPIAPNNSGFNATVTVLKRAFEIATTQTQVEQSLCLECMRVLSDKLDKEVEDVNRDIEAYEACLQRMEGESRDVLSEADFLKEKLKIEEEGRKLEAAIEETEKQYAEVTAELKELETKSNRFKELEGRYWHEFNNFQFQLISHQEERDAILAQLEVSQAHLELLKRTNVLTDAFPIWHDGDFGTINNFRLGRLPKIPVEWDEINAAWGQACLLLHTMCQYFQPKFPYRIKILPMGSYPRIMDLSNNTYELFGPVNLFWSTRYDKAMTLYLTCLKDFADFSYLKDQENSIPPEKCFKLPYKIENDKVKSYSITVSFNKQENWTKALKYTLWNLKWALYWFIGNTNFQPLSATVSQRTDPSAVGTLYPKRGTDLKFGSLNS